MGIGAKLGIFAASGGGAAFANQYSLDLDGSDEYAEGADALTSLSELTQASVSFWVYANDTAAVYLISQWSASTVADRVFAFYSAPASNRVDVYWGSNICYRHSALAIPDGEWVHVVATYNDATSTAAQETLVYINGTKHIQNVGFGSPASLPSGPGNGFTIGKRGGYTGNELNGKLDEVSIFTKELSQSEVTAIYNSGVPADLTGHDGLVHWWRCGDSDGGTGTTITDVVGSNDLTLENGPSFIEDVPS